MDVIGLSEARSPLRWMKWSTWLREMTRQGFAVPLLIPVVPRPAKRHAAVKTRTFVFAGHGSRA